MSNSNSTVVDMTHNIFAIQATEDHRTAADGFTLDFSVVNGETLRLVMGRPMNRPSRSGLTYHTGEIVLGSGDRYWAVIEQDSDTGDCISIGVCVPAPGNRYEVIFPYEAAFTQFVDHQGEANHWLPLAYRYLEPPRIVDPEIQDATGWRLSCLDLTAEYSRKTK